MKNERHSKILELISKYDIDTQEELLSKLKKCEFNVTQATVSRDIKELRLIKTMGINGIYKYSTIESQHNSNNISNKFMSIFKDSIINIDYAMNTVVIKCYVGMAQAACASLDNMEVENIVGTLAGDDTIFILMRNEQQAKKLTNELLNFINK